MSLRRETTNGTDPRGGDSSEERRGSIAFKDQNDKYASPKRTKENHGGLNQNELFGEDAEKDRYLITYADLITLLLGLFILLYVSSNVDIKKYEKMMSAVGDVFGGNTIIKITDQVPIGEKKVVKTIKDQVMEILDKDLLSGKIALIENERGVTVSIQDDILFSPGNSDLEASSIQVLSKIAEVLKKMPNDIRIEGHTDNIPIKTSLFPSNWHLSVARATNTAYYLMTDHGLEPDRVTVVGYAEYKPMASNESTEGRARNRRVDIVILK